MNSETIISIEEFNYDGMEGFIIRTDQQRIKLGISNEQSCYESWGYFMTEDDTSQFVGAQLLDIKITDRLLKSVPFFEGTYDGGVMFVNIETSAGTLQFVAYNEHNGFYGHEARVESLQLNYEEWL